MARKKPVEDVAKEAEVVQEPKAVTAAYTSTIYMVHPFTGAKFDRDLVTENVELDGWIKAQINAGILTKCS